MPKSYEEMTEQECLPLVKPHSGVNTRLTLDDISASVLMAAVNKQKNKIHFLETEEIIVPGNTKET